MEKFTTLAPHHIAAIERAAEYLEHRVKALVADKDYSADLLDGDAKSLREVAEYLKTLLTNKS